MRFFASGFIHESVSPQPMRTVSNFFKNLRRYWQVMVNHLYQRHRCQRHRWCTLSCEFLRDISKKFETALMVYWGAVGKLIHEKKLNISWHCPIKDEEQAKIEWGINPGINFKFQNFNKISFCPITYFAKIWKAWKMPSFFLFYSIITNVWISLYCHSVVFSHIPLCAI